MIRCRGGADIDAVAQKGGLRQSASGGLGQVGSWLGSRLASRRSLRYRGSIDEGLERAFNECTSNEEFKLGEERLVILSDHHRGARDGADDFWVAERAYNAALGYYLETGYKLAILGDAEELWENASAAKVVRCYRETLELERAFNDDDHGYWRFFGNHDLQWKEPGLLARHLGMPGIEVHESMKLTIKRGDTAEGYLFLVHGHQGTLFSDKFPQIGKPVVRHVWARWQRYRKHSLNTPARNYNLREDHETAMADWAKRRRPAGEGQPVLIAGHTHRPVFGTRTQEPPPGPTELEQELEQARRSPGRASEVPGLAAQVEHARASTRYYDDPKPVDPPCFFNTGCCSFSDGDITGIELVGEDIRLVRWSKFAGQDAPECLQSAPLIKVLEAVNAGLPLDDPQHR